MKKIIVLIICVLAVVVVYIYKDSIANFITDSTNNMSEKEIEVPEVNEYKTFEGKYSYVSDTDNFVPETRQDILNIIYTTLNSGWEEFTFYCPEEYKECIDEVVDITNDDVTLSNINGFVHPFNSFKSIETAYNTQGKVTLNVHKLYSDEMINEINKVVDKIYVEQINSSMSDEEKIRVIHDYIINNSKYDNDRINGITKYNSNTAYGNLIEGYGICSGYTDSMAIFLDRMKIPNYKISSDKHIWNLVYINGKWLNLDLTFDDPVTNTGEDILQHDYFLISTDELLKLDKSEHTFNEEVFKEALSY